MKRGCCFECGNQFIWHAGQRVFVERQYGEVMVKLHKECAKRWDSDKEQNDLTCRVGDSENEPRLQQIPASQLK